MRPSVLSCSKSGAVCPSCTAIAGLLLRYGSVGLGGSGTNHPPGCGSNALRRRPPSPNVGTDPPRCERSRHASPDPAAAAPGLACRSRRPRGRRWAAGTLRIGLNEDPGTLDPAQSGGFVDRIVFASLCDKLIDLSPKLDFVPQLATAWAWSDGGRTLTLHLRPGVRFQDGTVMDAAAVARQFRPLSDRAREPAQDRAEIRERRGGSGPQDRPPAPRRTGRDR